MWQLGYYWRQYHTGDLPSTVGVMASRTLVTIVGQTMTSLNIFHTTYKAEILRCLVVAPIIFGSQILHLGAGDTLELRSSGPGGRFST